jgi:MFS superfamily sulfate permease-like transporter
MCQSTSFVRDVISGTIMAATSLPQLIAYAETVGYAGYRGLSTAGPSLLVWGLATGSPWMNAGVTSITALMAKADLGGESYVAQFGEDDYVKLVAAYSMYIGLASILLAVIGFGTLAKSVPQPVRRGFKWGCFVGVLVSAVPNGFFAQGSSDLQQLIQDDALVSQWIRFLKAKVPAATGAVTVTNFFYTLLHPLAWAWIPTVIFLLCTALVMRGSKILPKSFPPGSEVILATAAATIYSVYFHYTGAVVGEIPSMDPNTGFSVLGFRIPVEVVDWKSLIEVPIVERCFGNSWFALAISSTLFAAINFLSIMGIASGFELENSIPWSAPRELASQGISCIAAALTGSAPVSGSLSRSLVARMTGATSKLACIITAVCWIYFQPYMSIMTPTPKAALSAVMVSAVLPGIFQPRDLNQLQGADYFLGWATGIITAFTSPTIGFGAGLMLYFAMSDVQARLKQKLL